MGRIASALGGLIRRNQEPEDNGQSGKAKGQTKRTVKRVNDRITESDTQRNMAGPHQVSVADIARRNGARFLGDHTSKYGEGATATTLMLEEGHKQPASDVTDTGAIRAQLNRTSTSIMATTAAMTESPVDVRFEEVETNDPWLYSLKPKAVGKLRLMLSDPVFAAAMPIPILRGFTEQELAGEGFIDAARAEWMQETMLNPANGAPILTDDDFHIVNDKTTAKVANTVFMNRWKEADTDFFAVEHLLYSQIFGFQPALFQWNFTQHTWDIENVHNLAVWPDPVKSSLMSKWDYVAMEHYIPLSKAVTLHGLEDFAPALTKAAEKGKLVPPSEMASLPSAMREVDYQRRMVQVRTLWEKHQKLPMRLDEALRSGAVLERDGGLVLPGGAEIQEGEEGWPDTFGIEQIRVLPQINEQIDQMRCPYMVEPLIWTVNTPIMHSPWGLGEPYRLEDVQRAINRELTVLVNWSRYYAYPVTYIPASLYASLKARGFKAFIRPGRILPINDTQYDKLALRRGRVSLTDEPPPMPRDRVGLLTLLLSEHDRLSGHVEALQGRTPGSQTSGKLFEQLRAEARGPLGLRAKFFENSMYRLARLAWDSMLKWMPDPVWVEMLNGYPPHVIEELRNRMAPNKFNITVSVSTTRGLSQQIAQDQSKELYSAGLLDRQTVLEDMHRDPDPIIRRIEQETQTELAMQTAAAQPAAPDQQGQEESTVQ